MPPLGVVAVAVWISRSPTSAAHDAKKSTAGGKAITLTGCLQAGGSADTFKLANVTGGPASTNKEWELMGAPASLKMADHVGHKVSVTGKVMGTGHAKKAVTERFQGFTRGVVSLRDIIYFASFIGFWLYLNTVIVEHRKAD